jgi:hypothetical protein
VKVIFVLLFIVFSSSVWGAQKAKIAGGDFEIYADADFDSDQIDEVREGEVFFVSDKAYGAFYRIKLKSGKVGYIVDYALNIEGKGQLKPKDLDELELIELKKEKGYSQDDDVAGAEANEDSSLLGRNRGGPVIQFINYREDTMGGEKVSDLMAIGYKSVGLFTWSALGTWQVPKYYSDLPGHSASGFLLWGDIGFSNTVGQFNNTDIRIGGGIMSRASVIKVTTPTRSYDLQDMTLGADIELAITPKFKKWSPDLFIKYYFDKTRYASVGFAVLF